MGRHSRRGPAPKGDTADTTAAARGVRDAPEARYDDRWDAGQGAARPQQQTQDTPPYGTPPHGTPVHGYGAPGAPSVPDGRQRNGTPARGVPGTAIPRRVRLGTATEPLRGASPVRGRNPSARCPAVRRGDSGTRLPALRERNSRAGRTSPRRRNPAHGVPGFGDRTPPNGVPRYADGTPAHGTPGSGAGTPSSRTTGAAGDPARTFRRRRRARARRPPGGACPCRGSGRRPWRDHAGTTWRRSTRATTSSPRASP